MKVLILSDIHGNLSALTSVLGKAAQLTPDACVLLGDAVDYGQNSSAVTELLRNIPYPVLCNIRGNHEAAIISEDYSRFSSERGVRSAQYTRSALSREAWDYIRGVMSERGMLRFSIGEKKCLAVHGSIRDEFWGAISPVTDPEDYRGFDYVFSGHSHIPHFFEKFIKDDSSALRGRKKIAFINPGSVGQPRNHNSKAQFALLDTETEEIMLLKASYDIEKEQRCFNGSVDDFYRERLGKGI